jgi:hypothetical protein|tara:strand:+ start:2971 stop:3201 length:231 start_codon:yes stop_codon:yes gene_type:complete
MTFKPRDLNVLAYANGFTMWSYVTEDPMSTVINEPEYWADAESSHNTKDGDVVFIRAETSSQMSYFTHYQGMIGVE